ncbi:collectin-10-like [Branchiostoma lanceolatum]|uniref:collectin-10-like n=1 Tax=Branchiostoma lanceolatum TaxID=7740 RepID=UPI00345353EE
MKTFAGAASACRAEGGTLAMPRDAATNTFLRNQLSKLHPYYWFGLKYLRNEGKSVWIDRTPLGKFNAYDRGKPDGLGDCVAYCTSTNPPKWGNGQCWWKAAYICEFSPGRG